MQTTNVEPTVTVVVQSGSITPRTMLHNEMECLELGMPEYGTLQTRSLEQALELSEKHKTLIEKEFKAFLKMLNEAVDDKNKKLSNFFEVANADVCNLHTVSSVFSSVFEDFEKTTLLKGYIESLTGLEKSKNDLERKSSLWEKISKIDLSTLRSCFFRLPYQETLDPSKRYLWNDKTPKVYRYGMCPSVIRSLTTVGADSENVIYGIPIDKTDLHPLERQLIHFTVDKLKLMTSCHEYISQSSNNTGYPNNVVLIDILARSLESDSSIGFVKVDDSNKVNPETHTVVLWKTKKDEYLLIDPSRHGFSSELRDAIACVIGEGVVVGFSRHETVDSKDACFYSTKGVEVGYSKSHSLEQKARDCVDIAVKIAFELNELQARREILELSSIGEILALMKRKLSNSSSIATHLQELQLQYHDKSASFIERGSHSSSYEERQNCYMTHLRQARIMSKKGTSVPEKDATNALERGSQENNAKPARKQNRKIVNTM